jgi:hypothetical protein
MGFLTNKITDAKKKNKIVILVGILEILALIIFGLTQRGAYIQGVNDCANAWCIALPNMTNYRMFCPANYSMFGNMKIPEFRAVMEIP